MFDNRLRTKAQALLTAARAAGVTIATAESCTGGLVAGVLTEIAGSSDVVERGFVTYSNDAKTDLLGVPPHLIESHGAVSKQVAMAMAAGALVNSRADISVAVTGIAGPGGGSLEKPVGLVHFAAARGAEIIHRECRFGDIGREQVRLKAVETVLEMLERLF